MLGTLSRERIEDQALHRVFSDQVEVCHLLESPSLDAINWRVFVAACSDTPRYGFKG